MLGFLRSLGRGLLRLPAAVFWIAAVLWMAGIWRLSAATFPPGEPSLTFDWIANLAHAPLFGILGLLFLAALARRGEPRTWPNVGGTVGGLVLLLVGLYAVFDEAHQSLVPGRNPSLVDIVTDLVGTGCVLWIVGYLGRPDAREGGVRLRLAGGIALCAASALLATVL